MTARHSMRSALLLAALLAAGLTGCAPDDSAPAPVEIPATPAPDATEEPQPSEPDTVFRMPTTCTETLPESRISEFDALGMELLAGPDGKYGDAYLADPTPEQLAGGITCI